MKTIDLGEKTLRRRDMLALMSITMVFGSGNAHFAIPGFGFRVS